MPGDFIGALPANPCIHPAGLPMNTSTIKVLRLPVESALRTLVAVMDQPIPGDVAAPQSHLEGR